MAIRTLQGKQGFTLIEMLVIVAIMGIIIAGALPSFTLFMQSQRITSVATAIKRQLIAAKVRAIANPQVHYGVYFDTTAGAPQTFIFQDKNSDGQFNTGEPIYQAAYRLPLGTKLQIASVANNVIMFRGDGSAKNDGWSTGAITVSSSAGSTTRTITVAKNIGKVYM
jgi:prepilin-type N-terminal cleavage/methylation domain-containing protein